MLVFNNPVDTGTGKMHCSAGIILCRQEYMYTYMYR